MAVAALLSACAGKHVPPGQAVFRIESREGSLELVPPSLPGGVAAAPIPFSQIIPQRYGFNPWEQYVNLSAGMRLAVWRMTGQTQTSNSYYGIRSTGRRGYRIQALTPESESIDHRARYMRLFYQTKFLKSPGQPIRPAVCLWSDSAERLTALTAEAKDNPGFNCGNSAPDCVLFPGKTTVTPEVEIVVNQKPRYVMLGSTVRELLRADRVSETADIRVFRKHRDRLVPVTWRQKAFVLGLPFIAGDAVEIAAP
jgi:hypothetical protein